jgi:hypothetical protein
VPAHKCPACRRRVRSAPYVSLQDRHTRKITRYHGNGAGCLEAATVEAQQRGSDEIVLSFVHRKGCNPGDRMGCRNRCFAGESSELENREEGAA